MSKLYLGFINGRLSGVDSNEIVPKNVKLFKPCQGQWRIFRKGAIFFYVAGEMMRCKQIFVKIVSGILRKSQMEEPKGSPSLFNSKGFENSTQKTSTVFISLH